MQILSGLSTIADRYRGFLVDQWGVLHDGGRPYPGAIDCLARLRASGARIIILSNSGRRGSENIRILESMGFARALYDDVVSAGDAARTAITAKENDSHRNLGRRCFLLARDADRSIDDELGVDLVDDIASADFIFLMSMDAPRQSLAGWSAVLAQSVALGLPMICGNPDLHRVSPSGTLLEAPGLVAQYYEQLGGRVHYYGKPCADIYMNCLERMNLSVAEIAAVGDSLLHDVAGAHNLGIDSIFVTSGVHREELGVEAGVPLPQDRLEKLISHGFARPTYAVPNFSW